MISFVFCFCFVLHVHIHVSSTMHLDTKDQREVGGAGG